jgi:putative phosphoesterase
MKILVISDTHQNIINLTKFAALIKNTSFDMLIHLGDNYDDADIFLNQNFQLIRVPGVYSSFYQNPYIENRQLIELKGWKFFLSHTITSHANDLSNDLKPEQVIAQKQCDIFLSGHTHIPLINQENQIVFLNPGQLKNLEEKGHPATYAQINLTKSKIEIKIKTLIQQKTYLQAEFSKP